MKNFSEISFVSNNHMTLCETLGFSTLKVEHYVKSSCESKIC